MSNAHLNTQEAHEYIEAISQCYNGKLYISAFMCLDEIDTPTIHFNTQSDDYDEAHVTLDKEGGINFEVVGHGCICMVKAPGLHAGENMLWQNMEANNQPIPLFAVFQIFKAMSERGITECYIDYDDYYASEE